MNASSTQSSLCPRSAAWPVAAAVCALAMASPLPARAGAVGCLVTPSQVADLGTSAAGVVEHIAVDRGDVVRKGQVLVTLRADAERAALTSAQVRADSEALVGSAQASRALARQKLERAEDLFRQQFISAQALQQAHAEHSVADQTLQQALDQRALYRAEVQQSRAVLASRTLTSPITGVVIDRMAHPGERVELQAVLRIVDVRELRVEAVLPASQFGSVRPGQVMLVQPEAPGIAAREAVVTQVDRVIDAASNTFRVRLSLPNADLSVPAGARCKLASANDKAAALVLSSNTRSPTSALQPRSP